MTDQLLKERGEVYGKYRDNAALAQFIKSALRTSNWGDLPNDACESLDMIASKMARIVNGDPEYLDNWDDIAGYATLVADRIRKNKENYVADHE